ncbi:sensor histidine kinase [Streptomyces sp. NPDC006332]|uniref:sensor histidine kinase n=1 Tax=Streptomyces sp. NPDC006332 TaxID=3155456 RepID=UPI0033A224CC
MKTGVRHVIVRHVLRRLRVLREDLWTVRLDPLPPSVWVRWLPHGVVCLAALGIGLGDMAQLQDSGQLSSGFAVLVGAAQGGATVLALRRPIPAWWLSIAATVTEAVAVHSRLGAQAGEHFTWPWTGAGITAHLFVLLLLSLRVRTRVSAEALVLTALVTYVLQEMWGASTHSSTGELAVCLSVVVVVLGIAVRGRREARAELGRQTTMTAEERARRTLLEERNRIARELHDVVAHHMSVISIQAQVAPHLVENPPDELKENLDGIRQNALDALTELRRVLGVLRAEHPDRPELPDQAGTGTAPHAPQPTLDRLPALVENTRAAGLTVTLDVVGKRRVLPPGVELSVYRIVQEALSNVLRHAPGATARVRLDYAPNGVTVRVLNSPPTRPAPPSQGAGHGLLGMRERATMLGGAMFAEPRGRDGGYEVYAFIPVATLADGLTYAHRAPGATEASPHEARGHIVYVDPATDPKGDTV